MACKKVTAQSVTSLRVRGFTYREVALELGISRMTAWRLANGVRQASETTGRRSRKVELPKVEGDGPIYPDIDPDDKDALIDRLQLENAILRGTQEVLKGRALGCLTNKEKSKLIEWLRANTGRSLKELTTFLKISKSSYEYWRHKLRNGTPTSHDEIADDVERIFREKGDCARGYRFVHAEFVAEYGTISEKIVRDIMRVRNLRVIYQKKSKRYSSYAGELDEAPENLPLREDGTHDFSASIPNEKWVTDITEFKLPDDPRKIYLSPIVDLFDSKPVAWSIGLHPDAELANSSLAAACATLRIGEHPFCHSDRGCHYRWSGWKRICEKYGIVRSMSRKGRSPDNAVCEGFFGRLKNEFFYGRDWRGVSAEEFIERLDSWMCFYSEKRLKLFVEEDGSKVYDTIDNRRKRLGLTA